MARQTKGLGWWFQLANHLWMALSNSVTEQVASSAQVRRLAQSQALRSSIIGNPPKRRAWFCANPRVRRGHTESGQ